MAGDNLGSLEQIEALHGDGLLEVDIVLLGQALGLHLGLTSDGNTECLVVDEPDVELVKCLPVSDGDFLVDIHSLVFVGVGLGEVDGGERRVSGDILEVHDTLERIDIGLDLAIGLNGRVNLHAVLVGARVQNSDALNLKLSLIELVLSNLGDSDKDAARR